MDISNYTAQGLHGLQTQDTGTKSSSRGTQIRAASYGPGAPSLQGSQSASQSAQESGLFDAVLDTINPLQHIPGVSSIYQAATGDESSPLANLAGGFLFGGPVGLMAGAAKSFFEMVTGKSIAEHASALWNGDQAPGDQDVAVAAADTVSRDPILTVQAAQGLSVQQYQDFAKAADSRHLGVGARANEVSWADTIWTHKSLKQATGLYENNQRLG